MLSLIFFVLTATVASATGTLQHDPHFKSNRTVIVQLFEWKFNDIAKECEEFLGPRGFGGVQVSPVSESVVRKDFARPWWERYHPISYEIVSRSGNAEEFEAMSRACNDAGVRIYVDVVLNHMAAPLKGGNGHDEGDAKEDDNNDQVMEGTGGSKANANTRDYPAVPFKAEHFHRRCDIVDYSDGHQIRNCEFKQLPDLDHSHPHVVDRIIDFLNRLVDMGAAGFRIDAAKYIWPLDLKKIFSAVKNLNTEYDFADGTRPFFLQEVIDLGREAISKTEYTSYGVVTESQHGIQIADVFNGRKPLSALINWGPTMGFLMPPDALVFVDTYYTQRGRGTVKTAGGFASAITNEQPKKFTMAVAFMLAHPYGIKRIMSSYRFENNDQGPPADEDGVIASPEFNDDDGQCSKDSQWVCEHRWVAIANMVAFANGVQGEGINSFQTLGPNQVAFCRGSRGFIVLNNDPELDLQGSLYACLKAGVYCDVISGSLEGDECTGRNLTVAEDGKTWVSLSADGDYGVMAIYEGSKI